jgi:hypothetical protein
VAVRTQQSAFVQFPLCSFPIHQTQLLPGKFLIANMVELHCSIVTTIAAMCTLTAQIFDGLLLFLYPSLLAIVIEAGFAD